MVVSSYNYLEPGISKSYGELFTGYKIDFSRLGAPTSVQTHQQLMEVENRLKEGVRVVEMGLLQPRDFEQIPKQHFREINALAKLAGAEVTMHAPILDPAGFLENSWGGETVREEAERYMKTVIDKAHELNPKGNVPVTFHASTIFAEKVGYKGGEKVYEQLGIVNQNTGEITAVKTDELIQPGMKKPKIWSADEKVNSLNLTEWHNHLVQLQSTLKQGDEILSKDPNAMVLIEAMNKGELTLEDFERKIKTEPAASYAWENMQKANLYYDQAQLMLNRIYENAYMYPGKEDGSTQEVLAKISEEWSKAQEEWKKKAGRTGFLNPIDKKSLIEKSFSMLRALEHAGEIPKTYVPIEEFALKKAATTIANVAWDAYNKYHNTAPIITVENIDPTMAFSKADSLSKLIKTSRQKFVEQAVRKGMSEREAAAEAEKLIGATWDTAHINLLRREGFEEKEVIEETKKIAPYVKKIHLTDNFGMQHSDLPPGMGKAPLSKMMAELPKEAKAIVEAGSFAASFKTSPTPYSVEALGAPIYSPLQEGPLWGQATGTYGMSPGGYGTIFPEQNFSMYGAGFTQLPSVLGGVSGRQQSRFSGAPIE